MWDEDDSQRGVKKAKVQAALRAARERSEQINPNRPVEIQLTSPVSNQSLLSPVHRICEPSQRMPINSTISNSQSSPVQDEDSLLALDDQIAQDSSISNFGPLDPSFDFDQYQRPCISPSQLSSAEGSSISSIEQIELYAVQSQHISCLPNELNTGGTKPLDAQYSIPSTSSTEIGSSVTSSISPMEIFGAFTGPYDYHRISSSEISSVDDQDFTVLGVENLALRRVIGETSRQLL